MITSRQCHFSNQYERLKKDHYATNRRAFGLLPPFYKKIIIKPSFPLVAKTKERKKNQPLFLSPYFPFLLFLFLTEAFSLFFLKLFTLFFSYGWPLSNLETLFLKIKNQRRMASSFSLPKKPTPFSFGLIPLIRPREIFFIASMALMLGRSSKLASGQVNDGLEG